jgi:hypothetical protein
MNKIIYTFIFSLIIQLSFAQTTYLAEHFDYPMGDSLQNHGWYSHSAGTTNPIRVHTSGLTWTQTPYIGSGVGNAAIVNNNGSDENRPLNGGISEGAAFISFLLKVDGTVSASSPNNRGYFFHIGEYTNVDTPTYTSVNFNFRARTFVTTGSSADKFRLGLTFNSGTTPSNEGVDMTSDLDTGETYLVVIKYQFIDGDANDEIFMYVFRDGDDISSEPSTPTLGPITGTAADMPVMQYVAFRQYNLNPNLIIDGIIVKDAWDLLPPIEENEKTIVNYWHFNTAVGDQDTVHADYSNGGAYIRYQPIDPMGTMIGRMDETSGTAINAKAGYDAGRCIRPRNPSENGELLITLNSEGFENLKLSYATQTSSFNSGMLRQVLYISTDGVNFNQFGDTFTFVSTDFELVEFDLSTLAAANDNPNLMAKIRFIGNNSGTSGNNRFDNVVLEGDVYVAPAIVNYWHFNTAVGDQDTVHADYSNGGAYIRYQPIDPMGTMIGRMDETSGTAINAKAGYDAGRCIRPRNPSENGELLITLNSEGFENLKLSYATQTSSFNSGMLRQVLYISTDGVNFNQFGDTFTFVSTDFELVEFDLSTLAAANDNPNLMAKIRFIGNNSGTSGNNRFDNVVLEGKTLGGVYVPVESIVVNPKDFTLALGDTQILSVAILPLAATNKEVIFTSSDETIATVNKDGEVIGMAEGMAYILATSSDSGLVDSALVTVFQNRIVTFNVKDESNNALENAKVLFDGQEMVTDANGSVLYAILPGTYNLEVSLSGYIPFKTSINISNDTALNIELVQLATSLIHYWHFNNLIPGNVPDNEVEADYSLIPNTSPKISLGFLPEYTENTTDPAYMDDYTPGSALNAQMGEMDGAALRVRNRMEHRSLLIELPTTDVSDLVLTFDVHRSGSGMLINHFEYSLDGGTNWLNDGIMPLSHTISETYETKTIDLSGISGANNNPNFVLRITYEGNIAQSNGNNRYDNIALFGKTEIINVAKVNAENGINIYPNPTTNNFTIDLKNSDVRDASYKLISANGVVINQNKLNATKTLVDASTLSKGIYFVLVTQGGVTTQHKVIVQ